MSERCETDSINLRTLKLMDDTIDEILLFGGQVAVYKYSFDISEWERKEIEGSMFVVRRSIIHNYGFVVINRLNTTNMFQVIGHNLDTKVQMPYLLYKNANNEIFCIWFYNPSDCVKVGEKIEQIVQQLTQQNNQLQEQKTGPTVQSRNDIFRRLMSVDLNTDLDKTHKNNTFVSNGQNPQQSQTPQRRTLQVKELFESQLASISIAPTTTITLATHESVQQSIDDSSLLNDVITPALLTEQSSKARLVSGDTPKQIPQNHKISQSPIVFTQPQQQVMVTPFVPNFISGVDRCGPIPSLTMEQLKQTLIHLLQNDADFLHSIHNAYIGAVNRK